MFRFSRLREGVYELRFSDRFELCMTFLRYQEFYEGPRYHDRKFTLAEYISWYVKEQGAKVKVKFNGAEREERFFSYPTGDWGGFNIPVSVIGDIIQLGIDDPNHYDMIMMAIHRTIMTQCDRAYLIGVTDDQSLDEHELTHAMYYLDDEYARRCQRILIETDPDLKQILKDVLFAKGYTEKTVDDEIQAYLTTGGKIFEKSDKLEPYEGRFQDLQAKLKVIHDAFYPTFIKDITPGK